MVNEVHLAAVTKLSICATGPPHHFPSSVVTSETRMVLFSDYLQYDYGELQYIFVKQIIDHCCNLCNSNCKLLTLPVNKSEVE